MALFMERHFLGPLSWKDFPRLAQHSLTLITVTLPPIFPPLQPLPVSQMSFGRHAIRPPLFDLLDLFVSLFLFIA